MKQWEAGVALDVAHELAESPVWDVDAQRLLWVDILRSRVFGGRLDGTSVDVTWELDVPAPTVGAVALATDDRLLLAAHDRLLVRLPDGELRAGPVIVPAGEPRRLNDGRTDPVGRYLVGSSPSSGPASDQRLWCVDHDLTVTVLDDGHALSNGLGWSRDGSLLYGADSHAHEVWVRPYDVATGTVGPRTTFLRVDDGFPDGLAIDAEDHVWVAVFGGGEIRRAHPSGEVVGRVRVDAPQVSSLAFAGPDLRTLVITTAQEHMTPEQVAQAPRSGRLFSVRVDVAGRPYVPWRGATPAAG